MTMLYCKGSKSGSSNYKGDDSDGLKARVRTFDHVEIMKDFNLKNLHNKKVLFLSGRECKDVPLFLEHGYSVKNLFGVERYTSDAKEASEKFPQITFINGNVWNINDVLKNEKFDLLHLDLCGQVCDTMSEGIAKLVNNNLNVNGLLFVAVNSATRCSDSIQGLIENDYKLCLVEDSHILIKKLFGFSCLLNYPYISELEDISFVGDNYFSKLVNHSYAYKPLYARYYSKGIGQGYCGFIFQKKWSLTDKEKEGDFAKTVQIF